jgi:hypothetical protein
MMISYNNAEEAAQQRQIGVSTLKCSCTLYFNPILVTTIPITSLLQWKGKMSR